MYHTIEILEALADEVSKELLSRIGRSEVDESFSPRRRVEHMLKKKIRSVAALAIVLGLIAAGTTYGDEKKEPDKKKKEVPGLKVGVKAPAFKLKDQSDKDVALSDILKKGPVALVFYRSASW